MGPLAIAVFVAGTLSVPISVLTTVLGYLPLRGALVSGMLLFLTVWPASALGSWSRTSSTIGAGHPAPTPAHSHR